MRDRGNTAAGSGKAAPDEVGGIYRALFDQSHDAMMVFDTKGRLFDWNKAALEIYGLSAEQARGRTMMEIFARTAPTFDFLSNIEPGVSGYDFSATSGDFKTMRLERDIRSPLDARLRSVEGIAFRVDSGGEMFTCIISRDVTASRAKEREAGETNAKLERRVFQKTAELREANQSLTRTVAQRSSLLQEVHHRVKNNLQFVLSLMHLQAASEKQDLGDFLELIESRIHLLMIAYEELLSSESYEFLDTESLLANTVDHIVRQMNERGISLMIETELDSVSVPVDTAIPLSFIVGESLQDFAVFTRPESPGMKSHISFERQDDGFRLRIALDGLDPEDPAAIPAGLGCGLLDALIDQIGGTYQVVGGETAALEIALPETVEYRAPAFV